MEPIGILHNLCGGSRAEIRARIKQCQERVAEPDLTADRTALSLASTVLSLGDPTGQIAFADRLASTLHVSLRAPFADEPIHHLSPLGAQLSAAESLLSLSSEVLSVCVDSLLLLLSSSSPHLVSAALGLLAPLSRALAPGHPAEAMRVCLAVAYASGEALVATHAHATRLFSVPATGWVPPPPGGPPSPPGVKTEEQGPVKPPAPSPAVRSLPGAETLVVPALAALTTVVDTEIPAIPPVRAAVLGLLMAQARGHPSRWESSLCALVDSLLSSPPSHWASAASTVLASCCPHDPAAPALSLPWLGALLYSASAGTAAAAIELAAALAPLSVPTLSPVEPVTLWRDLVGPTDDRATASSLGLQAHLARFLLSPLPSVATSAALALLRLRARGESLSAELFLSARVLLGDRCDGAAAAHTAGIELCAAVAEDNPAAMVAVPRHRVAFLALALGAQPPARSGSSAVLSLSDVVVALVAPRATDRLPSVRAAAVNALARVPAPSAAAIAWALAKRSTEDLLAAAAGKNITVNTARDAAWALVESAVPFYAPAEGEDAKRVFMAESALISDGSVGLEALSVLVFGDSPAARERQQAPGYSPSVGSLALQPLALDGALAVTGTGAGEVMAQDADDIASVALTRVPTKGFSATVGGSGAAGTGSKVKAASVEQVLANRAGQGRAGDLITATALPGCAYRKRLAAVPAAELRAAVVPPGKAVGVRKKGKVAEILPWPLEPDQDDHKQFFQLPQFQQQQQQQSSRHPSHEQPSARNSLVPVSLPTVTPSGFPLARGAQPQWSATPAPGGNGAEDLLLTQRAIAAGALMLSGEDEAAQVRMAGVAAHAALLRRALRTSPGFATATAARAALVQVLLRGLVVAAQDEAPLVAAAAAAALARAAPLCRPRGYDFSCGLARDALPPPGLPLGLGHVRVLTVGLDDGSSSARAAACRVLGRARVLSAAGMRCAVVALAQTFCRALLHPQPGVLVSATPIMGAALQGVLPAVRWHAPADVGAGADKEGLWATSFGERSSLNPSGSGAAAAAILLSAADPRQRSAVLSDRADDAAPALAALWGLGARNPDWAAALGMRFFCGETRARDETAAGTALAKAVAAASLATATATARQPGGETLFDMVRTGFAQSGSLVTLPAAADSSSAGKAVSLAVNATGGRSGDAAGSMTAMVSASSASLSASSNPAAVAAAAAASRAALSGAAAVSLRLRVSGGLIDAIAPLRAHPCNPVYVAALAVLFGAVAGLCRARALPDEALAELSNRADARVLAAGAGSADSTGRVMKFIFGGSSTGEQEQEQAGGVSMWHAAAAPYLGPTASLLGGAARLRVGTLASHRPRGGGTQPTSVVSLHTHVPRAACPGPLPPLFAPVWPVRASAPVGVVLPLRLLLPLRLPALRALASLPALRRRTLGALRQHPSGVDRAGLAAGPSTVDTASRAEPAQELREIAARLLSAALRFRVHATLGDDEQEGVAKLVAAFTPDPAAVAETDKWARSSATQVLLTVTTRLVIPADVCSRWRAAAVSAEAPAQAQAQAHQPQPSAPPPPAAPAVHASTAPAAPAAASTHSFLRSARPATAAAAPMAVLGGHTASARPHAAQPPPRTDAMIRIRLSLEPRTEDPVSAQLVQRLLGDNISPLDSYLYIRP